MIKFLQTNKYAAVVLTFLRLYVGWSFLEAGYGKLTKGFDASGFLKGAIAASGGAHPAVMGFWATFLKSFALPNVNLFNHLVPYGELLVGLGLILGCLTTVAVFFGMVMNFSFLFSGTTSTNPLMILMSIFVIVAGANAGKIGLDYWVIPYIKNAIKKRENKIETDPNNRAA